MLSLRFCFWTCVWIFRLSDANDQHDFVMRPNNLPVDPLGVWVDRATTVVILLCWLTWVIMSFSLNDIVIGRPTLGMRLEERSHRRYVTELTKAWAVKGPCIPILSEVQVPKPLYHSRAHDNIMASGTGLKDLIQCTCISHVDGIANECRVERWSSHVGSWRLGVAGKVEPRHVYLIAYQKKIELQHSFNQNHHHSQNGGEAAFADDF